MWLLARLNAFNRRHPWSHNDFYLRWVMRHARETPRESALDVGCGTGNLVALLQESFTVVRGLEPDPATARYAQKRFASDRRVTIEQTPLAETRDETYDAITLVAVLHQLPLEPTLARLRRMLKPSGRLIVVGCYREATAGDLLLSMLALALNPLVGFVKHPQAATRLPVQMSAPSVDAQETMAEIRAVAKNLLPGVRIRRRLFWRYSLVYAAD